VTLSVAERSMREIHVGDSVKVEIPALRLLDRRLISGRVRSVAREPVGAGVNPATRGALAGPPTATGLYRIVADLDGASLTRIGIGRLRKGYSVEAKIITRSGRIIGLVRDYLLEHFDRAT
jgi:hypothetical protein